MMMLLSPIKQAARARQAARKRGLAVDLTGPEWMRTIEDWQGKCAYCGDPYWTIDHYVPLAAGGGTTIGNCIPSCLPCNNRKASVHPEHILHAVPDVLRRIERYLQERERVYYRELAVYEEGTPMPLGECLSEKGAGQPMGTKEICSRIQSLASGKEVRLTSNDTFHLQLRDRAGQEDGTCLMISTTLTVLETYELGLNLLQLAYPRLEQRERSVQEETPQLAWK